MAFAGRRGKYLANKFILFFFYRDADDACHDLNGKEFMGERVSVEIAKGTPHGRDRDRWGTGPGGSGRRSRRFGHKLIFLSCFFFGKNLLICLEPPSFDRRWFIRSLKELPSYT